MNSFAPVLAPLFRTFIIGHWAILGQCGTKCKSLGSLLMRLKESSGGGFGMRSSTFESSSKMQLQKNNVYLKPAHFCEFKSCFHNALLCNH